MVASARELKVWGGGNGEIKPEAREMTAQGKNGEWTGHKVSTVCARTPGLVTDLDLDIPNWDT